LLAIDVRFGIYLKKDIYGVNLEGGEWSGA